MALIKVPTAMMDYSANITGNVVWTSANVTATPDSIPGSVHISSNTAAAPNIQYPPTGRTVTYGPFFAAPYSFQGSTSGYATGGNGPIVLDSIYKFPLTSDTPATDVAELSAASYGPFFHSSTTHGYTGAGQPSTGNVDKFPFSSDSPATDVLELSQARYDGASSHSETHGYSSGGWWNNTMDKFPFSSDAPAANIGTMSHQGADNMGGQSSSTDGYITGGGYPTFTDIINKFPFSSDTGGVDIAELSQTMKGCVSHSSTTHGYSGGESPVFGRIDKFTFASDSPASGVLYLYVKRQWAGGVSATAHGYSHGGYAPTPSSPLAPQAYETLDKYPFASDTDGTDVGEILYYANRAGANQI